MSRRGISLPSTGSGPELAEGSLPSKGGFTLLEVLVALSITAMAVALVAMSISAALRAYERAVEHLDLIQTEREALNRIYQNLTVTYISPYSSNLSQATTSEETWYSFDIATSASPYDALTFNSLNHHTNRINAKESDLAIMTVFARKDEEGQGPEGTQLLMLREGGSMNDRFEVTGGVVSTLATGLTLLNLDYLDTDGEVRHEWQLGDRGGKLPCAVVVTLGMRSEHLAAITACAVVPLVMTTSQPCRYEKDTLEHLCQQP